MYILFISQAWRTKCTLLFYLKVWIFPLLRIIIVYVNSYSDFQPLEFCTWSGKRKTKAANGISLVFLNFILIFAFVNKTSIRINVYTIIFLAFQDLFISPSITELFAFFNGFFLFMAVHFLFCLKFSIRKVYRIFLIRVSFKIQITRLFVMIFVNNCLLIFELSLFYKRFDLCDSLYFFPFTVRSNSKLSWSIIVRVESKANWKRKEVVKIN